MRWSWLHRVTGPRWGTPRVTLDTRQRGDNENEHGSQHSAHHFWPTGAGVPGISYIVAVLCYVVGAPAGQRETATYDQSSVSHLHQALLVLASSLTSSLSQGIWWQKGISNRHLCWRVQALNVLLEEKALQINCIKFALYQNDRCKNLLVHFNHRATPIIKIF